MRSTSQAATHDAVQPNGLPVQIDGQRVFPHLPQNGAGTDPAVQASSASGELSEPAHRKPPARRSTGLSDANRRSRRDSWPQESSDQYPLAGATVERLVFASLMDENAADFCRGFSAYLARAVGAEVDTLEGVHWRERERKLYLGEAHAGVVCGLQYVQAVNARLQPGIELLAAPVMKGARYGGQPIYFSDVVGRHDSPAGCLADLRGAVWAYNEPTSQSGYNLPRFVLALYGETVGFFGRAVESGSHQRSLEMIVTGAVDAAAIETIVLEQEIRLHPELAGRLKVIETIGPSSFPPLVVSSRISARLRSNLLRLVVEMPSDREGRQVMAQARIARFVHVTEADYDPIRRMARLAAPVRLEAPRQARNQ